MASAHNMAGGLQLAAVMGHQQQAALLAHQQQQQQQLAATRANTMAAAGQQLGVAPTVAANASRLAGKKRKAADKATSEKALLLIPESPLFNSLVEQEQHVNDLIKRRRAELQAAVNPYDCAVHKRLRVYIYNTHSHQPAPAAPDQQQQQAANGSSQYSALHEPPQWTLWVWGRLIDPESPPGAAASGADAARGAAAAAAAAGGAGAAGSGDKPAADAALPPAASLPPQPSPQQLQQLGMHTYPLTSFFGLIDIQLDPEQYPGALGQVTWQKVHHRGPHKDRIEVMRTGSRPVQVTITFQQDFCPPAYTLDPRLAEVLGMTFGQQQTVLTRLYSYIISRKPQLDLATLQLDDRLADIMGTKQLPAASLPQALGKLLQPVRPVVVSHTIETTGPSPAPITCVDFDVLLPTNVHDKIAPAVDAVMDDKACGDVMLAQDQKLTTSLPKLFEARRKRMMYLGFADDPVAFLNAIIASHAREMRTGRTGASTVERKTEVYREKWVDEAAARYLGRKAKQDVLFPALAALNAPQ